ncbi:uncharacterized protein LOC132624563 [Lycium barbarum]|uniref:uncharacterized protein LOC132624563 n=1 Tax=Lycium barbarum TaxID=112863 RepID=UPI00293EA6D8|nr:uncharacterized protein LOC132624563 [Lycium barbarum]
MNFYMGGSSNNNDSNSSSSSSSASSSLVFDDEVEMQLCMQTIHMNNYVLQCLQENQKNHPIRVGSIPGHLVINRDCEGVDNNLFLDDFSDNPCFNEGMFRRRYRMSRNLFLQIVDAIKGHDMYFEQRTDAMGRFGLSTLQKITVVFRMLAYSLPGKLESRLQLKA